MTVEDAAELRLPQPHVARLESRPPNVEGRGEVTLRALVRNALRMRPDRIVVGEVRGGEALDMLQAMNTGHDGSLTTVHASSPADAVRRIETMALMAGLDLPHVAVREQVAAAVDVIVHLVREGDGSRRVRFVDGRGRERPPGDARRPPAGGARGAQMPHPRLLSIAAGRLARRRGERAGAAQLALVVEILAAHVRAGRSLRQALADARRRPARAGGGRGWPQPRRTPPSGTPAADALAALGEGRDVAYLAAAVRLHTRSGGDLALLLERTAELLHERAAQRHAAEVATAQARATGRIVTAMPALGVAALYVADRLRIRSAGALAAGVARRCSSRPGWRRSGTLLIVRISAVDP